MSIMFNEICIYIYIYVRDGRFNGRTDFFRFHLYTENPDRNFFTKPKSLNSVLSLLSDHIQGNTVEKNFQILIKLNFIHIYTIVREKDWIDIW